MSTCPAVMGLVSSPSLSTQAWTSTRACSLASMPANVTWQTRRATTRATGRGGTTGTGGPMSPLDTDGVPVSIGPAKMPSPSLTQNIPALLQRLAGRRRSLAPAGAAQGGSRHHHLSTEGTGHTRDRGRLPTLGEQPHRFVQLTPCRCRVTSNEPRSDPAVARCQEKDIQAVKAFLRCVQLLKHSDALGFGLFHGVPHRPSADGQASTGPVIGDRGALRFAAASRPAHPARAEGRGERAPIAVRLKAPMATSTCRLKTP